MPSAGIHSMRSCSTAPEATAGPCAPNQAAAARLAAAGSRKTNRPILLLSALATTPSTASVVTVSSTWCSPSRARGQGLIPAYRRAGSADDVGGRP